MLSYSILLNYLDPGSHTSHQDLSLLGRGCKGSIFIANSEKSLGESRAKYLEGHTPSSRLWRALLSTESEWILNLCRIDKVSLDGILDSYKKVILNNPEAMILCPATNGSVDISGHLALISKRSLGSWNPDLEIYENLFCHSQPNNGLIGVIGVFHGDRRNKADNRGEQINEFTRAEKQYLARTPG